MIVDKLLERKKKLAVIGLGYVGLPIAVAFAGKIDVIGFDVNVEKIGFYASGVDPTGAVGDEAIQAASMVFTSDERKLKEAIFHIIAVPTPVNSDKTPNLAPVEKASRIVGSNLAKGAIVVYGSTVYPGVTEEICVPILEAESGLTCGVDFKVGYAPERMNPGDRVHGLEDVVKIVSGMDEASREEIAQVFELVVRGGVHRASSIQVAEAAKVVENSQRDMNIAFMNELAMVFDRMGIDTLEVIEAMNTKWNALGFYPGLVGGHCIGVDPYYFIYEAEKLGYHSDFILSGRKINDGMGKFVAETIIKQLVLAGKPVRESKVVIFGIAFKENISDIRNSKVADLYNRLVDYGLQPVVTDPIVDAAEVKREYGIDLTDLSEISHADCLVLAVPHKEFATLGVEELDAFFGAFENHDKIIVDVKGMMNKEEVVKAGYRYWRL